MLSHCFAKEGKVGLEVLAVFSALELFAPSVTRFLY